MSGIYLFPFGQADCFLVELDCGKEKKYVLIDGGSRLWPGAPLTFYLQKTGVKELELMILTHLHQDHLGWLAEAAKQLKVRKALLPAASEKILPALSRLQNREPEADCRVLERLERNLEESDASVKTVDEVEDFYVISIGEWKMVLIYPSKNIAMPFCGGLEGEQEEQKLISRINWDSMVWLIYREKKMKALFCGDCPEECFLDRFRLFKENNNLEAGMEFLKLSHHGRNDKGTVYFTEHIGKETGAKKILITNVKENLPFLRKQWEIFGNRILLAGEQEEWITLE